MRARTLAWIGAGLIIAAVILGGVGTAVAMSQGGATPWGSNGMMSGTPMGSSGMGGMMGPNGHGGMNGGMMGGVQQTPASTPATNVNQVTIANFAYAPSNIQVSAGTTVTWTNRDSAPHSVTFKNRMKDSGWLRQGQSFSYTFTTPGTFDYYCTVHPNMVARVSVTA
jgi:amicyanin